MAKKQKLRGQGSWQERIWSLLIDYVNADQDRLKKFKSLLTAGFDWISGDISDIESCGDIESGASLEALSEKYQPGMRQVFTWLSAPHKDQNLANHAVEFLRVHGTHIRMSVTASMDRDALINEWPDHCGSVISPVCKFVLDQIDRHDIGGERLRDVIPVGLCDRQGCGKFRLVKRETKGRVFCSNLCKAKWHQSRMTKAEKAERMRKYRAGLKEMARKPIRFSKPKNRRKSSGL